MFIMYFIHKILTNMFRPKHVGENFVGFTIEINYDARTCERQIFKFNIHGSVHRSVTQ